LQFLDRAVDPQTGTITARVIFPNPKNLLRPGLTCNVRVLNNSIANSIIIPYAATLVQMGEYFVFVINQNKVSQRKIEIGRTINNDMVIVNKGLAAGEQVVVEGIQKLKENSPVAVSSSN
jgi:membrane fusion protein (multidrug efflux system)